MDILNQLAAANSVPHTVLVFALVIASGLALGSVRFRSVNLGVAGVLFSGLIFGHFKVHIPAEISEFVREFGLILFVYTIGMEVGPGFVASLQKDGLRLNLLAAFIVFAGAVITVLLNRAGIEAPVAAGLFSGATTNTPSLAAAQQAFALLPGSSEAALKMPGMGYAMAYPFGIVGIILTMVLIRALFRIRPDEEAKKYSAAHGSSAAALQAVDLKVQNPNLNACPVDKIPGLQANGAVISRIFHDGKLSISMPDSVIYENDIVRVVGSREKIEELKLLIGPVSKIDFREKENIAVRQVMITRHEITGRRLEELDFPLYGITATRLRRGGIEFTAALEMELQFGDTLTVVGEQADIQKFASLVGNSSKELDYPQLIPVFLGIALGVIAGIWPIQFPGMPAPVKLGLAGGPLLVALLLSRVGRIGRITWYMPASANFMLREIGITLFLTCVGLKSGDRFLEVLLHGSGLLWMAGGALITFVPLFAAAVAARLKYKMNYLTLCGLLAGSMTDPPALAFANQITPSNAQVVSYAAVYPLVIILRVLCAQILVMFFLR